MSEMKKVEVLQPVIGSYAVYLDTGIWSKVGNELLAPEDVTIAQLKDFLLTSGGFIYLSNTGRFGWTSRAGKTE